MRLITRIKEAQTRARTRTNLAEGIAFDRRAAEAARQRTAQKNQRWNMRGTTGQLRAGLEKLEREVNKLENQKTKRYAISAFLVGMGMAEYGAIPFVAALAKGIKARQELKKYIEMYKKYPRVMLYLAQHTKDAYLKKVFTRKAIQEIRLRQIMRGPEQLKARLEWLQLRQGMKAEKAINEAFKWGIENGCITQRRGDSL